MRSVYVNGQRLIHGKYNDYVWQNTPGGHSFPLDEFPVFNFSLKTSPGFGDRIEIEDTEHHAFRLMLNPYVFSPYEIPKPCTERHCHVEEPSRKSGPHGWANCGDTICVWCKWHNNQIELSRLREQAEELAEQKLYLEKVKNEADAATPSLYSFLMDNLNFEDVFISVATKHDNESKTILEDIRKIEESLESQTKPKDPRSILEV